MSHSLSCQLFLRDLYFVYPALPLRPPPFLLKLSIPFYKAKYSLFKFVSIYVLWSEITETPLHCFNSECLSQSYSQGDFYISDYLF